MTSCEHNVDATECADCALDHGVREIDRLKTGLLFGREFDDLPPLAEQHALLAIAALDQAAGHLRLADIYRTQAISPRIHVRSENA